MGASHTLKGETKKGFERLARLCFDGGKGSGRQNAGRLGGTALKHVCLKILHLDKLKTSNPTIIQMASD